MATYGHEGGGWMNDDQRASVREKAKSTSEAFRWEGNGWYRTKYGSEIYVVALPSKDRYGCELYGVYLGANRWCGEAYRIDGTRFDGLIGSDDLIGGRIRE